MEDFGQTLGVWGVGSGAYVVTGRCSGRVPRAIPVASPSIPYGPGLAV